MIYMKEKQLQDLGLVFDPADRTTLIRLDEVGEPAEAWGLEQLASFAAASLHRGEEDHLQAIRLSRTSWADDGGVRAIWLELLDLLRDLGLSRIAVSQRLGVPLSTISD